MDSAHRSFDRIASGEVVCACVHCGARDGFGSTGEAGRSGWRALGGNQSLLLCPPCARTNEGAGANRAQRRAAASRKAQRPLAPARH